MKLTENILEEKMVAEVQINDRLLIPTSTLRGYRNLVLNRVSAAENAVVQSSSQSSGADS